MEDSPAGKSAHPVFVLDIGTRTIIGLAGHDEGGIFHVDASAWVEHPRRAMIDGQIEDIPQVAAVARQVKQTIEEKLGHSLHRVSVAAAGRALKTSRGRFEQQLPPGPVTAKTVFELESEAVNVARGALEANDPIPYTCVGHSVIRYLLDDYPFTTIVDHKGSKAVAEVIATFLPTEVVSSLRHCMDLLDLEIETLTLEPIAAMRAVIPADVRLLNLALVDIGAGTSDIALSADGAVAGYTMATVAGDEVTESIIKKHLVDFETAEKIKIAFGQQEPIHFRDILGFEHDISGQQLLDTIETAVDMLAKVIADKILECNKGAPAAVFLVGGGSKTPGLAGKLADGLGLEHNKVACAGTQFSGRILNEGSDMDDPEFATPVGIALVAADNAENEGMSVFVNGRKVRLFTNQATSVMDALLLSGYNYTDLMGRNGRSLAFTLNGARKVLRGGYYTAAEITLGGKPAALSAEVENEAQLTVQPATSGEDAAATVADFAEGGRPLVVTLNGRPATAGLVAFINGRPVAPEQDIQDQDEVEIFHLQTVGEFCAAAGVSVLDSPLVLNGREVAADTPLKDGDALVVEGATPKNIFALPKTEADVAAPEADEALPETGETPPEPPPAGENAGEEAAGEAAEDQSAGNTAPAYAPAAPELPEEPPAPELPEPTQQAPQAPPEAAPAGAAAAQADVSKPRPTGASPDETEEPAPVEIPSPSVEASPAPLDAPPAPGPEAEKPAPQAPPAEAAKPEYTEPPSGGASGPVKSGEAARSVSDAAKGAPATKGETKPPPAAGPASGPAPAPGRTLRIDLNGRTVMLPPKPGGEGHLLLDLLPLVDIDPANPKGPIVIRLNGEDAPYMQPLLGGDRVEIRWADEL